MEDIVRYKVFGGRLVNRLFVAPDVLRIFNYRTQVLQEHLQNSVLGSES
jgi:hypothetical protein